MKVTLKELMDFAETHNFHGTVLEAIKAIETGVYTQTFSQYYHDEKEEVVKVTTEIPFELDASRWYESDGGDGKYYTFIRRIYDMKIPFFIPYWTAQDSMLSEPTHLEVHLNNETLHLKQTKYGHFYFHGHYRIKNISQPKYGIKLYALMKIKDTYGYRDVTRTSKVNYSSFMSPERAQEFDNKYSNTADGAWIEED